MYQTIGDNEENIHSLSVMNAFFNFSESQSEGITRSQSQHSWNKQVGKSGSHKVAEKDWWKCTLNVMLIMIRNVIIHQPQDKTRYQSHESCKLWWGWNFRVKMTSEWLHESSIGSHKRLGWHRGKRRADNITPQNFKVPEHHLTGRSEDIFHALSMRSKCF